MDESTYQSTELFELNLTGIDLNTGEINPAEFGLSILPEIEGFRESLVAEVESAIAGEDVATAENGRDSDGEDERELTYEELRQQRIQRNREMFLNLGLDKHSLSSKVEYTPRTQKKNDDDWAPQPVRRSERKPGKPSSSENNASGSDGLRSPKTPPKHDSPRSARNSNPGRRIVGGRIYDSENGTTCHQCRQKTMDLKVTCTQAIIKQGEKKMCGVMLDEMCLTSRYGQTMEDALNGEWICPKCLGICNCSFCRRKKGKAATGPLKHFAAQRGFESAADYLRACEEGDETLRPYKKRPVESTSDVLIDSDEEYKNTSTPRKSSRSSKKRFDSLSGLDEDQVEQNPEHEQEQEHSPENNNEEEESAPQKPAKTKRKAKVEKEEDEDEEFEVEAIYGRKVELVETKGGKGKKKQEQVVYYLIKWKGYMETTWEPLENLSCPDLMKEFDDAVERGKNMFSSKNKASEGSEKEKEEEEEEEDEKDKEKEEEKEKETPEKGTLQKRKRGRTKTKKGGKPDDGEPSKADSKANNTSQTEPQAPEV